MPEILETNVKIKADASSLKKETKESISALEKLQEKYKQVSNELSRAFATKANANTIQALANQRNELQKTISTIKASGITEETSGMQDYVNAFDNKTIDKFGSSVSGAGDNVNSLSKKLAQLANRMRTLYYSSPDMQKKLGLTGEDFELGKGEKGVKSILNGLKKITLAMIGIRTVFSAISRSMSTYLAQNTELKTKIDALYYALGSMLAPILEWIVNLFLKLLACINAIVKGLGFAGINMTNFGKSAAKASKSLAPFDEINNISENSGGGDGGLGSALDGLNAKSKILDFLEAKAKEILAIILGIVTAIALVKLGLDALTATGIGLAVAGIVSLIQDLIDFINDPSWKNFIKILLDIGVIVAGLAIAFGLVTGPWAIALAALGALVLLFKDDIAEIIANLTKGIGEKFEAMVTAVTELWKALVEGIKNSGFNLKNDLHQLWENIKTGGVQLWEQLKLELSRTWTQIKNLCTNTWTSMKSIIDNAWSSISTYSISAWNNIKNALTNVWNGMWNVVRGVLNKIIGGVESMVNSCIRGINSLTSGLRSLGNAVLRAIGISGFSFGSISTISLPRLATGTNFVPQDMVAQLHQGEAVIPKRFNEEQFMNSEETNRLLSTLIEIVESKEFKAYVSSSDVGRASTEFINNQSRLLGRSVI